MLRLAWRMRILRSYSYLRTYSTAKDTSLSSSIRALMRSSAQPVAVITSLLPRDPVDATSSDSYAHGATLSSFSTISLNPPLLAFSLQTPSRMADALQAGYENRDKGAHFVINILSEEQVTDADGFSKPGLVPFSLGSDWTAKSDPDNHDNDIEHPLSASPFHASTFAKDASGESLPVLSNSLGSLACSIVSVLTLKDFETDAENTSNSQDNNDSQSSGSELFLARIHGVENAAKQSKVERLPLVYWNQTFTTVKS
jgi:flavin reductase (DIM6/NTAB) family NADH-FMN oxidoreductase RutF